MTPYNFKQLIVGIPEIDRQHWALLEFFDDVIDSIVDKADTSLIDAKLVEITELVKRHYAKEEELMNEMGFPFMETHIDEHAILIKKMNDIAVKMKKNPSIELVEQARKLVTTHIVHYDLLYVSYARNLKALGGK